MEKNSIHNCYLIISRCCDKEHTIFRDFIQEIYMYVHVDLDNGLLIICQYIVENGIASIRKDSEMLRKNSNLNEYIYDYEHFITGFEKIFNIFEQTLSIKRGFKKEQIKEHKKTLKIKYQL